MREAGDIFYISHCRGSQLYLCPNPRPSRTSHFRLILTALDIESSSIRTAKRHRIPNRFGELGCPDGFVQPIRIFRFEFIQVSPTPEGIWANNPSITDVRSSGSWLPTRILLTTISFFSSSLHICTHAGTQDCGCFLLCAGPFLGSVRGDAHSSVVGYYPSYAYTAHPTETASRNGGSGPSGVHSHQIVPASSI